MLFDSTVLCERQIGRVILVTNIQELGMIRAKDRAVMEKSDEHYLSYIFLGVLLSVF